MRSRAPITGVWQTTGRQGRRQVENASFSPSTWNTVEDGKVLPLYQQLRYNVTVKGGINLAFVTASGQQVVFQKAVLTHGQ
jgi:hypothetical protein